MAAEKKSHLGLLLIIGGVLIGGFVLARFVLFKDSGGGDESAATTTTLSTGSSTTTTSPSSEPPLVFEFTGFVRDPFIPRLVVSDTGTAGTGTSTGGTGTSTEVTSTTASTGTVTTTTLPKSLSVGALELIRIDQSSGTARVRLNAKNYVVTTGDIFASNYRLVAVDSSCGQFVYGDMPFRLCVEG